MRTSHNFDSVCLTKDSCLDKWNITFFHNNSVCLDRSLFGYVNGKKELGPISHQLNTAFSHLSSTGTIHEDLNLDNVTLWLWTFASSLEKPNLLIAMHHLVPS